MPTVRIITKDAMRALKALAPGDDPDVDELNIALEAFQNLCAELHNGMGPLHDVDVSAASWIPAENQRLRIQSGATTAVTLPNAVPMYDGFDPYDYGFNPASQAWLAYAPQGTTAAADNIEYRQPRDGARIEIVGTGEALYFYRADINAWMPVYGLTLDTESPFNARYAGPLGALLAERLLDSIGAGQASPALAQRIARANAAMRLRTGNHRPPARIQNF